MQRLNIVNNDIIVGGVYKFEPADYASTLWLPGVVEVIDHGYGGLPQELSKALRQKQPTNGATSMKSVIL